MDIRASMQRKEFVESRHAQRSAQRSTCVDDANLGTIAAGVFSQQQQHSECRAIHAIHLAKIDHVTARWLVATQAGLMKLAVHTEVEVIAELQGKAILLGIVLDVKIHGITS
jgi:hypothetical protein